jgi:hypothetical protein
MSSRNKVISQSLRTDTEQADDNHNKQQDQASPQWLWYNILTFLRDDIDHNTL